MKIAIKEVGKPLRIEHTTKKYRGDCVRQYIKAKEEYVYLNREGTLALAVDEAGLPKELPINFLIATQSPSFPIQKMVGTVVFVRRKPVEGYGEIWDYEVDDITEDDIKRIQELLNEEYQKFLKRLFVDYGRGYPVFTKL